MVPGPPSPSSYGVNEGPHPRQGEPGDYTGPSLDSRSASSSEAGVWTVFLQQFAAPSVLCGMLTSRMVQSFVVYVWLLLSYLFEQFHVFIRVPAWLAPMPESAVCW